MRCPMCGSVQTYCTNSRLVDDENAVRRRKRCRDCDHRWSTMEVEIRKQSKTETALRQLAARGGYWR